MTVPARVGAPAPTISADLFRAVFRQHAAGVAVITAMGARPVGFTATSLTSVAAVPPLVSFGAGTNSSSWPVLAVTRHVGIHLLREEQRELASTFARNGADRFAEAAWSPGPYGVPLLDGVLGWLVCRVLARVPAGDHRLLIAEALAAAAPRAEGVDQRPTAGGQSGSGGGVWDRSGTLPPGRPLLYHQGAFHGLRH